MGFINRESKRIFGTTVKNPVLDTMILYDFIRKRIPSHGSFASPPRDYTQLYDMARSLGIPVSGAHNAMMDAFITAQLFQRLIPMLSCVGILSLGNLLKLSLKGGDRFRVSCEIGNF
jgi:DNA polymerase-3 subunit epsilon